VEGCWSVGAEAAAAIDALKKLVLTDRFIADSTYHDMTRMDGRMVAHHGVPGMP
jgi:hypothetical protein